MGGVEGRAVVRWHVGDGRPRIVAPDRVEVTWPDGFALALCARSPAGVRPRIAEDGVWAPRFLEPRPCGVVEWIAETAAGSAIDDCDRARRRIVLVHGQRVVTALFSPGESIRIAVFGLGYVGSVTSACLAKLGHDVVGVDPNEYKVGCLARGESPIVEKDLGDLIAGAARASTCHRIADRQTCACGNCHLPPPPPGRPVATGHLRHFA